MKLGINGRAYRTARQTGIQRYTVEIARRLARDCDQATLFVPGGTGAQDGVPAERVMCGRLRGHLWEQAELPVSTRACDVVFHPAATAPLISRGQVIAIHDLFPLTNPEWYTHRFAAWYRIVLPRVARRARRIVTFSSWTRDQLVERLGVDPARVVVTVQGCAPFEHPASAGAVARARDRFLLAEPFLLAGGAGDPRKHVEFLVDLVDRWPGRSPVPVLVVCGDAPAAIYRRSSPASSANVRFVGHVSDDDLHALYTGAIAFCHPARAEGFGRPPLEAMACGTPVIAALYGSARETLGDSAVLLEPDPGAWSTAIDRLRDDPDLRNRAGAEGMRHTRRFNWPDAATQVAQACREVCA